MLVSICPVCTAGRHETAAERDDRNWGELLQELRVSQTGVQLLTGLLLTLPFQDRFSDLDDLERGVYLVVVAAAVASTAFLIAPVALHRMLFRQGAKGWLVTRGNLAAHVGLGFLAIAMTGVVWLIFDVVAGLVPGTVAALLAAVAVALDGSGHSDEQPDEDGHSHDDPHHDLLRSGAPSMYPDALGACARAGWGTGIDRSSAPPGQAHRPAQARASTTGLRARRRTRSVGSA